MVHTYGEYDSVGYGAPDDTLSPKQDVNMMTHRATAGPYGGDETHLAYHMADTQQLKNPPTNGIGLDVG